MLTEVAPTTTFDGLMAQAESCLLDARRHATVSPETAAELRQMAETWISMARLIKEP